MNRMCERWWYSVSGNISWCHLSNLHANIPPAWSHLGTGRPENICEVSHQCLVRRQCGDDTMQVENNTKKHTSSRCPLAGELFCTASCFCSGDLRGIGISIRYLIWEHMWDAKITMHQHTWPFLFFFLSNSIALALASDTEYWMESKRRDINT